MAKPMHVLARAYTELYAFHLVPIDPGRKFPSAKGWGNQAISDPDKAESFYKDNPDWNMGVALGPSGMCSLDIDCDESFSTIMEEFGIDPDELIRYPTIQGRDKGRRLLFKVPDGASLPYEKLTWKRQDEPAKSYTVFELRASCDGKQRQDVLPPSIHPDTCRPYKWLVKPPAKGRPWPEPPKWLIAMWLSWGDFKPQLQASCPWAEDPLPAKAKTANLRPPPEQGDSIIQAFVDAHDLRMMLEQYGYSRKGRTRYLSPHTTTGLPGVILFPGEQSCWIHHSSDPLCSEEHGRPVNAFDLFCEYEHGGHISKAVKATCELLGIKSERNRPEQSRISSYSVNEDESPQQHSDAPPDAGGQTDDQFAPYRCLGYNGSSYYYLPKGTEQVSEIRRSGHTSAAELISLAPYEWWQHLYPTKKESVDWIRAGNDLMRACEHAGIYTPDRVRGRGAWYDNGRTVLHLGDHLLVDGTATRIGHHDSRYIYTKQSAMEHGADCEPADDEMSSSIADMFDQLNWTKPAHAQMFAGWCFLAPICGGLSWRPHIWLTSQRGVGKTWIQDHIVNPLIGPAAIMVQGETTEAGIRQTVGQDARPIIFDEAESEDERSIKRIKGVVSLARQASSDGGAQIIKGTATGGGMAFRMRAMFMLSSINVSLTQAADESRFTVLSLARHEKTKEEIDRFNVFSAFVDNTLTNDVCGRIRARAYAMIPVIRKNAHTFARAVAEELGSQRIGDQVGTLIAGACGLYRADEVTLDEARRFIQGMDFEDAKEAEKASDEESCLNRILQSQVRFESDRGYITRALGEIVDAASGREAIAGILPSEANDVLCRFGLAVEGTSLLVANSHSELGKLLKDTPWGSGWRQILARIDGATPNSYAYRFAGIRSRAIRIPLSFTD